MGKKRAAIKDIPTNFYRNIARCSVTPQKLDSCEKIYALLKLLQHNKAIYNK